MRRPLISMNFFGAKWQAGVGQLHFSHGLMPEITNSDGAH
jgi:hypothetical protein